MATLLHLKYSARATAKWQQSVAAQKSRADGAAFFGWTER
jgi:hypothetical protein